MTDIFCYCIDMPHSIKGLSVINEDSSFTIYINSRLSYVQQVATYKHELRHIKNGDLYSEQSTNLLEVSARERIS